MIQDIPPWILAVLGMLVGAAFFAAGFVLTKALG